MMLTMFLYCRANDVEAMAQQKTDIQLPRSVHQECLRIWSSVIVSIHWQLLINIIEVKTYVKINKKSCDILKLLH